MKTKIFFLILLILINYVYSFQYLSESNLCIIDLYYNNTCLEKYDNYSLTQSFYYFQSYDKHYTWDFTTDKGELDFYEIITKIVEFLITIFIGFIIFKIIYNR